jgi:hypothetical protein
VRAATATHGGLATATCLGHLLGKCACLQRRGVAHVVHTGVYLIPAATGALACRGGKQIWAPRQCARQAANVSAADSCGGTSVSRLTAARQLRAVCQPTTVVLVPAATTAPAWRRHRLLFVVVLRTREKQQQSERAVAGACA